MCRASFLLLILVVGLTGTASMAASVTGPIIDTSVKACVQIYKGKALGLLKAKKAKKELTMSPIPDHTSILDLLTGMLNSKKIYAKDIAGTCGHPAGEEADKDDGMKLCMKAATGLLERWKKLKKISSCPIARALSISAKVSLAISIIAGLVYGLEADQMKKMKLKIAAMVAAIAAGVLQLLAGAKWSSCAQECEKACQKCLAGIDETELKVCYDESCGGGGDEVCPKPSSGGGSGALPLLAAGAALALAAPLPVPSGGDSGPGSESPNNTAGSGDGSSDDDDSKKCSVGSRGPPCDADSDCKSAPGCGKCSPKGFCEAIDKCVVGSRGPPCEANSDCKSAPGCGGCSPKGFCEAIDKCAIGQKGPPCSSDRVCGELAGCGKCAADGFCQAVNECAVGQTKGPPCPGGDQECAAFKGCGACAASGFCEAADKCTAAGKGPPCKTAEDCLGKDGCGGCSEAGFCELGKCKAGKKGPPCTSDTQCRENFPGCGACSGSSASPGFCVAEQCTPGQSKGPPCENDAFCSRLPGCGACAGSGVCEATDKCVAGKAGPRCKSDDQCEEFDFCGKCNADKGVCEVIDKCVVGQKAPPCKNHTSCESLPGCGKCSQKGECEAMTCVIGQPKPPCKSDPEICKNITACGACSPDGFCEPAQCKRGETGPACTSDAACKAFPGCAAVCSLEGFCEQASIKCVFGERGPACPGGDEDCKAPGIQGCAKCTAEGFCEPDGGGGKCIPGATKGPPCRGDPDCKGIPNCGGCSDGFCQPNAGPVECKAGKKGPSCSLPVHCKGFKGCGGCSPEGFCAFSDAPSACTVGRPGPACGIDSDCQTAPDCSTCSAKGFCETANRCVEGKRGPPCATSANCATFSDCGACSPRGFCETLGKCEAGKKPPPCTSDAACSDLPGCGSCSPKGFCEVANTCALGHTKGPPCPGGDPDCTKPGCGKCQQGFCAAADKCTADGKDGPPCSSDEGCKGKVGCTACSPAGFCKSDKCDDADMWREAVGTMNKKMQEHGCCNDVASANFVDLCPSHITQGSSGTPPACWLPTDNPCLTPSIMAAHGVRVDFHVKPSVWKYDKRSGPLFWTNVVRDLNEKGADDHCSAPSSSNYLAAKPRCMTGSKKTSSACIALGVTPAERQANGIYFAPGSCKWKQRGMCSPYWSRLVEMLNHAAGIGCCASSMEAGALSTNSVSQCPASLPGENDQACFDYKNDGFGGLPTNLKAFTTQPEALAMVDIVLDRARGRWEFASGEHAGGGSAVNNPPGKTPRFFRTIQKVFNGYLSEHGCCSNPNSANYIQACPAGVASGVVGCFAQLDTDCNEISPQLIRKCVKFKNQGWVMAPRDDNAFWVETLTRLNSNTDTCCKDVDSTNYMTKCAEGKIDSKAGCFTMEDCSGTNVKPADLLENRISFRSAQGTWSLMDEPSVAAADGKGPPDPPQVNEPGFIARPVAHAGTPCKNGKNCKPPTQQKWNINKLVAHKVSKPDGSAVVSDAATDKMYRSLDKALDAGVSEASTEDHPLQAQPNQIRSNQM